MVFDFECISGAIRDGMTLLGGMVECGVNRQAVDYASWLFTRVLGGKAWCVEDAVRAGRSLLEAMGKCGLGFHEVAEMITIGRLADEGYTVHYREEKYPEAARRRGALDLIAHEDGKWTLVEVKDIDQLYSYSEAAEELGGELLFVVNVNSGRKVKVWDLAELGLIEGDKRG